MELNGTLSNVYLIQIWAENRGKEENTRVDEQIEKLLST